MSDRRRHLLSSVVVLILCISLLPSAARADAPAAPVLWESVLRSPDGQPTTGEVVAYVRPPAAELQPGDQLTEVARVQTDDSGRFVVRAFPSPAFRAAQDSSGWVTIGQDFSIGITTLYNGGKKPVVVERVRLLGVTGPLELLGVNTRMYPQGDAGILLRRVRLSTRSVSQQAAR